MPPFTRRHCIQNLLTAGGGIGLSACSSTKEADLGALYSEAAQRKSLSRNPVVLIPGIMGSKLKDTSTGEQVFGVVGGGNIGKHMQAFAHPMAEGVPLNQLRDTIVSDGVLDSITLSVGARIDVKAYAQILATLGAGGYRDESLGRSGAIDYGGAHYTCFQFDYDWRRSCAENAAQLDKYLKAKRAYVEAERRKRFGTTGRVKFDIVAHSMGGMLSRYYQMYGAAQLPANGNLPSLTWSGSELLGKVILVGTPNAGSAKTLLRLVDGYKPAAVTGTFPPGLLGTIPSLYELLPRERHRFVVDSVGNSVPIFDPQVWESNRWCMADPKEEGTLAKLLPDIPDASTRRRIALDHQRKCLKNANQLHAALDRTTKIPAGQSLYLFAGDSEPTARRVTVDQSGRLKVTGTAPGDKTVTRLSALLDERGENRASRLQSPIDWSHTTFISSSHIGLTKDPTFTNNMLHLLLER